MTADPTNFAPRFTLLAIVDEVTTCDCCGKAELKCTMALEEHDTDGNAVGEVYYGRDCGARALGWGVSADRAEKVVRGTARLSYDELDRIWRGFHRTIRHGSGITPTYPTFDRPAVGELDGGIEIEVWNPFYGKLPEGRPWTQVGTKRYATYFWRLSAKYAATKAA